jgi:hypothetical protein
MIPSNLNCCRFEILENNKQTRESTALSVAYNVEHWRRGWEGIVGRRRRLATWTYPYNFYSRSVDPRAPKLRRDWPLLAVKFRAEEHERLRHLLDQDQQVAISGCLPSPWQSPTPI